MPNIGKKNYRAGKFNQDIGSKPSPSNPIDTPPAPPPRPKKTPKNHGRIIHSPPKR